jgi:hypothetical protein
MLGVTALRAVSGGAAGRTVDGLEVAWVTGDGDQHRARLADAWSVRFEWCLPARRFPSYKGQRHFVGRWWSSTAGGHVGYELARDVRMIDPPWRWILETSVGERPRLLDPALDEVPDAGGTGHPPGGVAWTELRTLEVCHGEQSRLATGRPSSSVPAMQWGMV